MIEAGKNEATGRGENPAGLGSCIDRGQAAS